MNNKRASNFLLPLSLLHEYNEQSEGVDIDEIKKIIEKELKAIKAEVAPAGFNIAPRVSVLKYIIDDNYDLPDLRELENSLSLAIGTYPIRVSLFSEKEKLIVIEIPNKKKAVIGLREALEDSAFNKLSRVAGLPAGRDDNMSNDIVDLKQQGNIILAGATNSGKSVFFHSTIISLLFQRTPQELGLILIDPKRVEFNAYKDLPHLRFPVIVEANKAKEAFDWCMEEIDRRYDVLQSNGIGNITNYNLVNKDKWPNYILMIDEIADLMVNDHDYFFKMITRIAGMGSAVGFNIILGTSRPDPKETMPKEMVDEFLVQIAFSTASENDSVAILGERGGEKLLGQGDMLFKESEIEQKLAVEGKIIAGEEVIFEKIENAPRRLQGFFVSDNEIDNVIKEVIAGNYVK